MKNLISILIVMTFITSCGFKVVDRSRLSNFEISEINTKGDKKVGYIIRNKLMLYSSSGGKELISINLNSTKKKIVREKNIKNEITKYEIKIVANVNIKKIYDGEDFEFTITKNGNYDVAKQNSTTRNNEKQLILLLSNDLADEILSETNIKLNDS